jgi:hypothetical protein
MDGTTAHSDLVFLRSVLERTQRRVDPHAHHFVGWGLVVLVSYPLQNLLELRGAPGSWQIAVGATALLAGIVSGVLGEMRVARRERSGELTPEDPTFSRQVILVVWGALAPAILLSAFGVPLQLVPPHGVPIVWGFAYAALAWGMGVVYTAEFRWAAVLIFLGALVALRFPTYAGLVLGPPMGLGLLVPGLLAMRRVREQARSGAGAVA